MAVAVACVVHNVANSGASSAMGSGAGALRSVGDLVGDLGPNQSFAVPHQGDAHQVRGVGGGAGDPRGALRAPLARLLPVDGGARRGVPLVRGLDAAPRPDHGRQLPRLVGGSPRVGGRSRLRTHRDDREIHLSLRAPRPRLRAPRARATAARGVDDPVGESGRSAASGSRRSALCSWLAWSPHRCGTTSTTPVRTSPTRAGSPSPSWRWWLQKRSRFREDQLMPYRFMALPAEEVRSVIDRYGEPIESLAALDRVLVDSVEVPPASPAARLGPVNPPPNPSSGCRQACCPFR